MSAKTDSELSSLNNSRLPDNNTRFITADKVRKQTQDIIDSKINVDKIAADLSSPSNNEVPSTQAVSDVIGDFITDTELATALADYVKLDGTEPMTGDLDTGGNDINTGGGNVNTDGGNITTADGNLNLGAGLIQQGGNNHNLPSTSGTLLNENDITDFVTDAELATALLDKQDKAIVVSSNQTAVNDGVYNNVATATYTDPTPVEGKGFTVFVRNGTATVGGTAYANKGTKIVRTFHSGSWSNEVYTVDSVGTITPVNTPIADNDSINTFASKTQGQIDANKTYQDETLDYLRRVKLAGGRISDYSLSLVDAFVSEGKSSGWFNKLKDCWIPLGDFTASQVFLVKSGGNAVFENFVSTDYSEANGYQLITNTNKRIKTGLIPNNEGLTSIDMTFGAVSTMKPNVAGSPNSYILGYVGSGVDDKGPYMGDGMGSSGVIAGFAGRVGQAQQNFGGIHVHTSDGTNVTGYQNGVKCETNEFNTVQAQDREISLFASWRGDGVQYYSKGGIGAYFIGTKFTDAQALSISNILSFITNRIRNTKGKDSIVFFGDSIMAGQGSGGSNTWNVITNRYTFKLAQLLGLGELNVSQPSRQVNIRSTRYVPGIIAYLETLNFKTVKAAVCLGINDARSDANKTTGGTPSIITNVQTNLTTILNDYKNNQYDTLCIGIGYATDAGNTACQEAYALACANAAKSASVLFMDAYRLFLDTGTPNSYLFDTVHPNQSGHLLLAQGAEKVWKSGMLYRRPSITGTTINAGVTTTFDFVVLNAVVGASVILNIDSLPAGLIASAVVNVDNNVRISIFNPTGGNIVLPNTYAKIFVDKTY